jgi:hypothetical protein
MKCLLNDSNELYLVLKIPKNIYLKDESTKDEVEEHRIKDHSAHKVAHHL